MAYLLGWVRLFVIGGALACGAFALRRLLLPSWHGAPARLAEIAIAVVIAVLVCEFLGAFGWFERWPVLVGVVLVSGTFAGLSHVSIASRTIAPVRVEIRESRTDMIAATLGVAIISAQWFGKIAYAYAHGMTHPDTVWYHGPYAVEFVQRGHLLGQLDRTDPLHAYGSQTSELLHAILILAVGRDDLSPLVNVGWFGVALLAAWCIGHSRGFGALCVLGAGVALGLPTIVSTHPGQASNDVVAATFVLVAIALLLEGDLMPAPTALAASVAGLAFSTKVTAAAPVAVLTIGVFVVAVARRHIAAAIVWCVALLCTGSYWIVRNIMVAHNPFPYYTLNLRVMTFTRAPQRRADAVAKYLFDGATWRGFYLPGLRVALGDLWPLVLGIAFVGSVAVAIRRQPVFLRIAAFAGLAGFVAYLFTPYTADYGLAFTFNVRYAEPSFLVLLAIAPLAAVGARSWVRLGFAAAFVAAIVVDALAANKERVPAWPSDGRVVAMLTALAIVVLASAFSVGHLRTRTVVPITIAAVFVFGYPIQRYYADHRYVASGLPNDPVDAALQPLHGERIAFFGTDESYPFYGAALTNRVDRPTGPAQSPTPDDCKRWIRALTPDHYIVIAHEPFVFEGPVEATIAADHGVQKIAGNEIGSLYEVVSPLQANAC